MRKAKRTKINLKKVFCLIIAILIFIILYNKFTKIFNTSNSSIYFNNFDNNYEIIKQDSNSNYLGLGQTKVPNKDGYFITFTTDDTNGKKVYKEYKQNNNSSYSNNEYWGSTMSESGCGLVSISIVLSGYNKNYTPEDLRQKYYPKMNYDDLSNELNYNFGIKNSDFYYDLEHLSKDAIIKHLKSNRPIIVCVWSNPTRNRWTTSSHYMVLLATDGDNMIYVSNPNGLENDSKSSGWYKSIEIVPYIAKALYIEDF